ncbi:hypothetical protein GCM10027600_34610 [Nocardioides ginsengisegetis]
MRWLHTITSLDPRDGGPPVVVLELSTALARAGHLVEIITMRKRATSPHPLEERARAAGVKIVAIRTNWLGPLRLSLRYLLTYLRRARHADVLVVHGFYQTPCLAGGLAARVWRKPSILQPHGVFEAYQESQGSRFKPAFMWLVGRRLLHRFSAVVAAAPSERMGLVRAGAPREAIHVVGFGVPSVEHQQRSTDQYSSRRVLFLSRVAPKKRLDLLIQAVDVLNDRTSRLDLTVCGTGSPEYVEALKEMQRYPDRVHWLGHVEGHERAHVEATHALFCLPTDNENYGLSITEAMAAGLPVLTTAAAGAAEHVLAANAGTVLTAPTGPVELAAALTSMLADPQELAAAGERGARYAARQLSWATIAENWTFLAMSSGPK